MKKKLQIVLTKESCAALENMTNEASAGFDGGSITYSDIVNELLLTGKLDIKTLQAKHTNIRRSLRLMAMRKDIDIDSAIKALTELKSKVPKKSNRSQLSNGGE